MIKSLKTFKLLLFIKLSTNYRHLYISQLISPKRGFSCKIFTNYIKRAFFKEDPKTQMMKKIL
jgi:hypothetical protein